MLKFKRLAKVVPSHVISSDDPDSLLEAIYERLNLNAQAFLLIEGPDETDYTFDLDRYVTDHYIFETVTTVGELVETVLTPQDLYTYQTDKFNFHKYLRHFPAQNVPEDLIAKACKLSTQEESNLIDDPAFKDLVVRFPEFKLSKTLPVIDGLIHPCSWLSGKIYIPNGRDLLVSNPSFSFLSFADAEDIVLAPMREIADSGWDILDSHKPLIIIGGSIFYDDLFIFRTNGKIRLNPTILEDNPFLPFTSVDEMIDDPLSFIIFVKSSGLYIEELSTVRLADSIYRFCTMYKDARSIDFIAIDKDTRTVVDAVELGDKYDDITLDDDPYFHHIYCKDSGNAGIMQITII